MEIILFKPRFNIWPEKKKFLEMKLNFDKKISNFLISIIICKNNNNSIFSIRFDTSYKLLPSEARDP